MSGNALRGIAALMTMLLVAACSGCSLSTEQTVYDIGLKAIRQDPSFTQGAVIVTPAPRSRCTFYIGKSAASVEMPYSVSGSATAEGTYVVWLNRIGTRWELDRSFAVPRQR